MSLTWYMSLRCRSYVNHLLRNAQRQAEDAQKLHHVRALVDQQRFEDHHDEGVDRHEAIDLALWHIDFNESLAPKKRPYI